MLFILAPVAVAAVCEEERYDTAYPRRLDRQRVAHEVYRQRIKRTIQVHQAHYSKYARRNTHKQFFVHTSKCNPTKYRKVPLYTAGRHRILTLDEVGGALMRKRQKLFAEGDLGNLSGFIFFVAVFIGALMSYQRQFNASLIPSFAIPNADGIRVNAQSLTYFIFRDGRQLSIEVYRVGRYFNAIERPVNPLDHGYYRLRSATWQELAEFDRYFDPHRRPLRAGP